MKRILIVSGGTGGHIFPALAFGKWIRNNKKTNEIYYMCGSRKVELDIYNSEGIDPIVLDIEGSPLGTREFRRILNRSCALMKETGKIFGFFKNIRPDFCLLFGGYVSIIPLIIAILFRIPVAVHEQNTVSGRVTRLAHKLGISVLTGWEECEPFDSTSFSHVGIPVRKFIRLQEMDAWNILHIGCSLRDSPTVVVMGGSLGSEGLVRIIVQTARRQIFSNWNFIVLGKKKDGLYNCPMNVFFTGKQWDMNPVFSVADVAVVRGGASSLAELYVYGIPALVVPWLKSSDSHQLKNAEYFLKKGSGEMWIEEKDSLETFAKRLNSVFLKYGDTLEPTGNIELRRSIACETIWEHMIAL